MSVGARRFHFILFCHNTGLAWLAGENLPVLLAKNTTQAPPPPTPPVNGIILFFVFFFLSKPRYMFFRASREHSPTKRGCRPVDDRRRGHTEEGCPSFRGCQCKRHTAFRRDAMPRARLGRRKKPKKKNQKAPKTGEQELWQKNKKRSRALVLPPGCVRVYVVVVAIVRAVLRSPVSHRTCVFRKIERSLKLWGGGER